MFGCLIANVINYLPYYQLQMFTQPFNQKTFE